MTLFHILAISLIEGSGVSGMQWKSAVMQLLQGQADMQLCLTKVQKQHVQVSRLPIHASIFMSIKGCWLL